MEEYSRSGEGVRIIRMNDDPKNQLKQLLSNAKALLEAMLYSTSSVSGEFANMGRYGSYKTFLRKYNALAKQAIPLLPNVTVLDQISLDNIGESAKTTWPHQKEYFDMAYSNTALLKSLLEGAIGYAEDVDTQPKRLHPSQFAQDRLHSSRERN